MKFIVQLVANFLRAVLTSCQKLLSQHKLNLVDACVFCTTVFLAAGYYYPWCLIVAFVCMLPPLQEQLYLPDDQRGRETGSGGAGEGSGRELTLEEKLQAQLQHEEHALARELAGGVVEDSSQPLSDDEQEQEQEQRAATAAAAGRSASSPDTARGGRKRDKTDKKEKRERERERKAERDRDRAASAKPRVGKSVWGLPTLRVRDSNGVIVEINSEKPVPIETDYFKGTILIMLRTEGDLEQFNRYEHHFRGKQRKFEVQFQVSQSVYVMSVYDLSVYELSVSQSAVNV